jgi:hypothetical protein
MLRQSTLLNRPHSKKGAGKVGQNALWAACFAAAAAAFLESLGGPGGGRAFLGAAAFWPFASCFSEKLQDKHHSQKFV